MAVEDSYTKSLMHFNGPDESTDFIDESGKIWTHHGGADLDTSAPKFGTAAGEFNGSDAYITTPFVADFDFGNGDFTIDFWVKFLDTVEQHLIYFTEGAYYSSFDLYFVPSIPTSKLTVQILTIESNLYEIDYPYDFSLSTWYHIAVVRHGSTLKLYIGGVACTDTQDMGTDHMPSFDAGNNITVGVASGYYFNGKIDEMRCSNGVARWISNFTPPTEAYVYPSLEECLITIISSISSEEYSEELGFSITAAISGEDVNEEVLVTIGSIISMEEYYEDPGFLILSLISEQDLHNYYEECGLTIVSLVFEQHWHHYFEELELLLRAIVKSKLIEAAAPLVKGRDPKPNETAVLINKKIGFYLIGTDGDGVDIDQVSVRINSMTYTKVDLEFHYSGTPEQYFIEVEHPDFDYGQAVEVEINAKSLSGASL